MTLGKKIKNRASKLTPEKLKPLLGPLVDRADQVLLGLSHTKQSIPALLQQTLNRIEKNPDDIVGHVGRTVLERAEIVRKQLVEKADDSEGGFAKRWVPEWVKDVSFSASPTAEKKSIKKSTKKARTKSSNEAATAKKTRAKKV